MTLLEVLAALALLSGLALASTGWISLAARSLPEAAAHGASDSAAESVLRLIHDDLASGDFETADTPRVAVIDGALTILTRSSGAPVLHAYRLDQALNSLIQTEQNPTSPAQAVITPRVLLECASFDASLDEKAHTLQVSISGDGRTRTRFFRVP